MSTDTIIITTEQLQALQDGINTSIQTILKAYDGCADPKQSQTLINQASQLAGQMNTIEQKIGANLQLNASEAIANTFTQANGITGQITKLSANLEDAASIIIQAGDLIQAVTTIVSWK